MARDRSSPEARARGRDSAKKPGTRRVPAASKSPSRARLAATPAAELARSPPPDLTKATGEHAELAVTVQTWARAEREVEREVLQRGLGSDRTAPEPRAPQSEQQR